MIKESFHFEEFIGSKDILVGADGGLMAAPIYSLNILKNIPQNEQNILTENIPIFRRMNIRYCVDGGESGCPPRFPEAAVQLASRSQVVKSRSHPSWSSSSSS